MTAVGAPRSPAAPICSARGGEAAGRRARDSSEKKSFFPFCSDRCRMVDLGRWLTGQYVIPGETVQEEEMAPPPSDEQPD